jgi:hypothetical protein
LAALVALKALAVALAVSALKDPAAMAAFKVLVVVVTVSAL